MQAFHRMFRRRTNILGAFLLALAALLLVRAAILTVGSPNRLKSNLAVMNRSPQSFEALGNQIEELERITSNIDSYKLSEIKDSLTRTARLAAHARTEFQAQYDSWVSIRGEISRDKDSFHDLRTRLDDIQRLQDSQILHLKHLLEESMKPSLIADSINLAISFLTGVVSSILASLLYEKWRVRRAGEQIGKL